MKKSVKKRWVEALRSGEYQQRGGVLHDGVGFCCLGVLCDVEIDGDWVWNDAGQCFALSANGMAAIGVLSRKVALAVGLDPTAEGQLIAMNDRGKSFDEIADWIEANL